MPRRRSGRFVLEALFLAAVATALTIAELRPAAVIALMALAWVIVAVLEWAAWLDEPHYGRGLPPRFYVPQVALPPPRAIEQAGPYAAVLDPGDEPTFDAPLAEWAIALEAWPLLDTSPADEETQIGISGQPAGYGYGPDDDEPEAVPGSGLSPEAEFPPEAALLPEVASAPASEAPLHTDAVVAGPVPPLHPVPGPADEEAPPEEPAAAEPVEQPLGIRLPEPIEPIVEPRPDHAAAHVAEPARPRLLRVEPRAATTVHHIDPLASSVRRRRLRRSVEGAVIDVPDGPPSDRQLPGLAARTTERG